MSKILIFGGTTEGRRLSELLSDNQTEHTVCVATEYGSEMIADISCGKVLVGRLDAEQMADLIRREAPLVVVDATHPYAELVSENIRIAAEQTRTDLLRLLRGTGAGCVESFAPGGRIRLCSTHEECALLLKETGGNILLTCGSKELKKYCDHTDLTERLYVRVLPSTESIETAHLLGIGSGNIIAMQGPFTAGMNEAIFRQYKIKHLVTKDSGRAGGFEEKLAAAEKCGMSVYVIGRPGQEEGMDFDEVCQQIGARIGKKLATANKWHLTMAGAGMGYEQGMSAELLEQIEAADVIFGAARLLTALEDGCLGTKEHFATYRAVEILDRIEELASRKKSGRALVLYSGDTGFYSGLSGLQKEIRQRKKEQKNAGLYEKLTISVLPGISSVSYLAARTGISYDDAVLCSIHGRECPELAGMLRHHRKVFLLLSDAQDLRLLGEKLTGEELKDCRIMAGICLGSPNEMITELTPAECRDFTGTGICCCFVLNPHPQRLFLAPCLRDDVFIRDRVPMTKEEVREVAICKLKLTKDALVYDIGSGTGSIAIQIAMLSEELFVYAIEQKKEAAELIRKNCSKLERENVECIEGQAPEALKELKAPSHVMIGGSGGRLREILDALADKKKSETPIRVVITAVSLDTISLLETLIKEQVLRDAEMVSLQVGRMQQAGSHRLMKSDNQVWICSGEI